MITECDDMIGLFGQSADWPKKEYPIKEWEKQIDEETLVEHKEFCERMMAGM